MLLMWRFQLEIGFLSFYEIPFLNEVTADSVTFENVNQLSTTQECWKLKQTEFFVACLVCR